MAHGKNDIKVTPEGRSVEKQHCNMRTKPLLQGLGTRQDCRLRLFFVRTERTSSKLTFREKSIHDWWFRNTKPQINCPRFSQCAISTTGVLLLKLWFLSQTDFPIYGPRLPLLKSKMRASELWLTNINP